MLVRSIALLSFLAASGCATGDKTKYEVQGRKAVGADDGASLIAETGNALAAVAAPGIFGKNDRPPQLVKSVAPEVPREAIARNIGGEVTAELEVTATGTVSKVNILRSSDELFSSAVVSAMKQWVFTPLILNGSPATFKIRQTYRFRLDP